MQKNCTKNSVQNQAPYNSAKNYKNKLQHFVKQEQKHPAKQSLTADKIITQLVLDTLEKNGNESYNSNLLEVFQHSQWGYQISSKFLQKVVQKNNKIQSICSALLLISDGYFEFNSQKVHLNYVKMPQVFKYQSFFIASSKDNYFILFEVGLHKELKNLQNLNQVDLLFNVSQKITFIDIFFHQQAQELTDTLQEYQLGLSKDFYRTHFNQLICSSPILPNKIKVNKEQCYLFNIQNQTWPESTFKHSNENIIQWMPLEFKLIVAKRIDYIIDPYTQRYIEKSYYNKQREICHNEEIANQNKYKLQQYVDSKSVGFIIDLLQRSPEFKIRLSNQEREVVSTPNNALVIGRSGTGKTTSIIMRMFASQTLMKVRCKLFGQKKSQFLNDFEGQNTNVHSIFTTANRFLVNEVEKFYQKLENQAKLAIAKHRESGTFNLDDSLYLFQYIISISQTYSEITNYEDDVLDFVQQQGSHTLIKQQISSHTFQQNEQQPQSNIQSFLQSTYPAFFSTEQLLILLDKQMGNPYFSTGNIRQLRYNIRKLIGFLDCEGIDLDIYFPENNQSNDSSSYKQQSVIPEVNFQIFSQQFWPLVAPRERNNQDAMSLPSLVWTQIYSYIKGSQYSYRYPHRHLPLSLYRERVSNYISEEQIEVIYQYFEQYEKWKQNSCYFDQLDIVNNLLVNIESGLYKQFPIHYVYIDEVQDLPQAVIELFCKITEQGVVFCGDTAQCILKGVGFRFQDLQTLFKNSKKIGANDIEKFQVYQLTKNFRSHNNILQLANCIVNILELLFPKTLDHLKKEISNLQGPKPIFFSKKGYRQIFSYLNDQYYAEEQCEIEFGYSQVVIVKSKEAKRLLPDELKKETLVLTTFQAKGLEFDDVIIYNCFTSEPITSSQWDFLSCLDIKELEIENAIFEANMTKHGNSGKESQGCRQFPQEGKIQTYKLCLNSKFEKKQSNDYSSLCNELKTLYVCVTRAKKRVLVYDDEPERRFQIENIFRQSDVCEFFEENQNYSSQVQRKNQAKKNQQQEVQQQSQTQDQQQSLFQRRQFSEEERAFWEKQGQVMYQRKIYDEAMKCFTRSGNEIMLQISQAYHYASEGSEKLARYNTYKMQYKKFKTLELKIKMEQVLSPLKADFKTAAESFSHNFVNDPFQAANCYYSGQHYEESLLLFLNLELFPQAAKSAKRCKNWKLAMIIYFKMEQLEKCLKILNNYDADKFFQYDQLLQGLKLGMLSKAFVEQQLCKQENQANNIFVQLEKKSRGIDNHDLTQAQYCKDIWPGLSKKTVDFQKMFHSQINIILKSQIQIDDDLLEMVYTEIQMFWNYYFQILESRSIINQHQYSKLEQLFSQDEDQQGKLNFKNSQILSFMIDILEQLKQFQLLSTLFSEQSYFYLPYMLELKLDIAHLNKDMNIPYFAESIKDKPEIIYHLLYAGKIQDINNLLENTAEKEYFLELKQILSLDLRYIGQADVVNYCNFLFIYFKQHGKVIINEKTALEHLNDNQNEQNHNLNIQQVKIHFHQNDKKTKDINILSLIISIQHDLFNQLKPPSQAKLIQIFSLVDSNLQDLILLLFIKTCAKHKKYIKLFFKNCSLVQILYISKLLLTGSSLFSIDNNMDEQKQLFRNISPIYSVYMTQSRFLNIFGQTFIFLSDDSLLVKSIQRIIVIPNKLWLVEQKNIMEIIKKDFTKLLNLVNPIKLIFSSIRNERQYIKAELYQTFTNSKEEFPHKKTLSTLLIRQLEQFNEDSQDKLPFKQQQKLLQISTIFSTFIIAIPNQFVNQLLKRFSYFGDYLKYSVHWKNQLSIASLQYWVEYVSKLNQKLRFKYPDLLLNDLNFVVLILSITFHHLRKKSKRISASYQILSEQFSSPTQLQYSNKVKKIQTEKFQENSQDENLRQKQFQPTEILSDQQSQVKDQRTQMLPINEENYQKANNILEDTISIKEQDERQLQEDYDNFTNDDQNVSSEDDEKNIQDNCSSCMYITNGMVECHKYLQKFYEESIIVNTQIQLNQLCKLTNTILNQLFSLLQEQSFQQASDMENNIMHLIFVICYNCKVIEQRKTFKRLTREIKNCIKKITQQYLTVKKNEKLKIFLVDIVQFFEQKEFTIQQNEMHSFNIDIDNQDSTLQINSIEQINYDYYLYTFKIDEQIESSYQVVRNFYLLNKIHRNQRKEEIYELVNSLKRQDYLIITFRFLNYCINEKSITFSQNKQLIKILIKISSIEEILDENNDVESLSKCQRQIEEIDSKIECWISYKCNIDQQSIFSRLQSE